MHRSNIWCESDGGRFNLTERTAEVLFLSPVQPILSLNNVLMLNNYAAFILFELMCHHCL